MGEQRYDTSRCKAEVYHGKDHRQCSRKPGHGPEGAYCKQHDPDAKAIKRNYPAAIEMIQSIAAGHHDPKAAAQAFLDKIKTDIAAKSEKIATAVWVRIFSEQWRGATSGNHFIEDRYALDSAADLACWGYNARHFVTSIVVDKTEYTDMTDDEAEAFRSRCKLANDQKRIMIADMNAGRL